MLYLLEFYYYKWHYFIQIDFEAVPANFERSICSKQQIGFYPAKPRCHKIAFIIKSLKNSTIKFQLFKQCTQSCEPFGWWRASSFLHFCLNFSPSFYSWLFGAIRFETWHYFLFIGFTFIFHPLTVMDVTGTCQIVKTENWNGNLHNCQISWYSLTFIFF